MVATSGILSYRRQRGAGADSGGRVAGPGWLSNVKVFRPVVHPRNSPLELFFEFVESDPSVDHGGRYREVISNSQRRPSDSLPCRGREVCFTESPGVVLHPFQSLAQ